MSTARVSARFSPDVPRIDPDLKARWVEALRSGKYTQGAARLKQNGAHCCLGVLCEINELEQILNTEDGITLFEGSRALLPPHRAMGWNLSIFGALPLIVRNTDDTDDILSLTTLNDSGFTFSQIADVIEYFL